jgi:hypothetical protein
MLAVPAIGAVLVIGRPIPPGYWQWLWFLSVLGMPAGYAMALTVVPSVLVRRPRDNYRAEALVALILMAAGLFITRTVMEGGVSP